MEGPKKVKPAVYQCLESKWGWVQLAELAEIVGWEPQRLFETFTDLAITRYKGEWVLDDLHWMHLGCVPCCKVDPIVKTIN